jgi:hypothetical protein
MKNALFWILIFSVLACSKEKLPLEDKPNQINAIDGSYLYKSGEKLEKQNIKKLTKIELILMKTEIYARHGILKGKKWQKMYIKFKKWYNPEKHKELSDTAKKNISLLNNLISSKDVLVKNVKIPGNLIQNNKYTLLKLTKQKRIKSLSAGIKDNHWNYLLNKEYGMERNDKKLANLLKMYKGLNGFFVSFKDENGVIRVIKDFTGCCGVILSNEPRRVYIFSKEGRLLKLTKFFHDKKESEKFYFYRNGKLKKEIVIIYNISTGRIIEADIYTGDRIE